MSTTTNPCPYWCTEPPGHPYHQWSALDDRVRHHFGTVAEVEIAEGSRDPALVSLAAMETAAPAMGMTGLVVEITGYREGDGMTAGQARQLAAALLNAADLHDEITGGA